MKCIIKKGIFINILINKISFKCINSTKVKSVKINLCEFILLSKYFVIIKIIWFLYK